MIIKEFPRIVKNGKEQVSKTDNLFVLDSFVKQLHSRGTENLSCFRENENGNETIGIGWSEDFNIDDLLSLVMNYLIGLDQEERLIFLTELQTAIMTENLAEKIEDDNESEEL